MTIPWKTKTNRRSVKQKQSILSREANPQERMAKLVAFLSTINLPILTENTTKTFRTWPTTMSTLFVRKGLSILNKDPIYLKDTPLKESRQYVLNWPYPSTSKSPNTQLANSSTPGSTCSKALIKTKIKDSKNKEPSPKPSSRTVMACRLSATTCQICNFITIFRDGGGYNRAITTIIRESYKKIEDFLLKQCNIKIHSLTSSEFSLVKTPLVHCRNILTDEDRSTFFKYIAITYKFGKMR